MNNNTESNLEQKKKQNNIMEKFLEEYNQMKKDKEELLERMEKTQLNYNSEIMNEKEKQKKLQSENAKLNKTMRDLKNELSNYEQKLTKKEMECSELKKRIDSKVLLDDKTKDRDSNIFMKFLGRKPVSSNSQDQKLVTILNHFENQKEKLEKECAYWKKESEQIRDVLLEQKGENAKICDDDKNKSRFFEKVKEELMNQVSTLQEEKERLLDMNLRLTKNNDNLQREHSALLLSHNEIKDLYKQLRIDYQNVVHKNQEQYLEFQSIKSEQNMHIPHQQQKNQLSQNYQQQIQQQDEGDENINTMNYHQQQLFTQPEPQEQNPYNQQTTINHFRKRSTTPETQSISSSTQQNSTTKRYSDHKLLSGNRAPSQQAQQVIAAQQEIIQQLCEIYSVESEDELVQCAQKTEIIMQAIPKMESLLSQITETVFGNNILNNENNKKEKNIERIVPILQKWKQEIKLIDQFVIFKDKLCESLQINNEVSTDRDILNQVEQLKNQIQNNINNNTSSTMPSSQTLDQVKQQKQVVEFMKLFEIGENDNVQNRVSQIYLQLNDISRFIKITKKLLDLDEDMRSEACLTYILKLLEKMKMNKYNDPDLIMKIQKALKLDDPVQILNKIETLQKNNKMNTLINSQNSLKKIQI